MSISLHYYIIVTFSYMISLNTYIYRFKLYIATHIHRPIQIFLYIVTYSYTDISLHIHVVAVDVSYRCVKSSESPVHWKTKINIIANDSLFYDIFQWYGTDATLPLMGETLQHSNLSAIHPLPQPHPTSSPDRRKAQWVLVLRNILSTSFVYMIWHIKIKILNWSHSMLTVRHGVTLC